MSLRVKNSRNLLNLINSENHAILKYFKSKTIKQVWNSKTKFFINRTLRAELNLLSNIFSDPIKFKWEIPLRYLIPTEYDSTILGNACLEGGGAFCDELNFWYFAEWLKLSEELLKLNLGIQD